jgi:hypothetical protein
MWNSIETEDDIKNFMNIYSFFHDSCLKELKYVSGAYVNSELSIIPFNSINILKMIIQRQYNNPTVIEMEFSNLKALNLIPETENDCIILGASLFVKDNYIYWADCDGLENVSDYNGTWVCSKKLRWRAIDKHIGESEVYCENQSI